MLQIFFYCAWNAIYNFTKHAILIYAYGLMYTLTNLSLHMIIFIVYIYLHNYTHYKTPTQILI